MTDTGELNITPELLQVLASVSTEWLDRLEGKLSDRDLLAISTALAKAVARSSQVTAAALAQVAGPHIRVAYEPEMDLWADRYGHEAE